MDPHTGLTYELEKEGRDYLGEAIEAKAAIERGMIDLDSLDGERRDRLTEMAERGESLVAVGAEAVQRARLGDRELRRRKQRRR